MIELEPSVRKSLQEKTEQSKDEGRKLARSSCTIRREFLRQTEALRPGEQGPREKENAESRCFANREGSDPQEGDPGGGEEA